MNVVISANHAEAGGGGFSTFGSPIGSITNAIIWDNYPDSYYPDAPDSLWVSFSDIHGSWEGNGTGNINADPLFCATEPPWLHTLALNSPCLGSGIEGGNMGGLEIGCDSLFNYAGPVWHVALTGSDSTGNGSSAAPFRTIQYAISQTNQQDTVLVQPGLYQENINLLGRSAVVGSLYLTSDDADYIGQTVIEGGGEDVVVTLNSQEDSSTVLCGFTLQGGQGDDGGGIYCSGSSPTLRGLVIRGNYAHKGGGLYVGLSSIPFLAGVTITGNEAQEGGGLYQRYPVCFDSLNRCSIYHNHGMFGQDIARYSAWPCTLYVDTFTVLQPTEYYIQNLEGLFCNIQHGLVEQYASDLWVDPDGDDSNSGTTPQDPLRSITRALQTVLVDPDHPRAIRLGAGDYSVSTTGELLPLNVISHISLIGSARDSTRLDGEDQHQVLALMRTEAVVVESLTVTRGWGVDGGGVYTYYSEARFANVALRHNFADDDGGGVYAYGYSYPADLRFSDVIFAGNGANWRGGGLATRGGTEIRNCIFYGNEGGEGGAISGGCDILNTTVWGNSAIDGGGLYTDGDDIEIVNSIFWDNEPQQVEFNWAGNLTDLAVAYTDLEGGPGGITTNGHGTVFWLEGNLNAFPCFVNPQEGDFNLTYPSPCIDAGSDFFVWNSDTLINLAPEEYCGEAPDMGALEYDPQAVPAAPQLPREFSLSQNYPNPFNPTTTIRFALPRPERVTLAVYNLLGQRVEVLVDEMRQAGWYSVQFDATRHASGLYFYRMSAGDFVETRKMMIVK